MTICIPLTVYEQIGRAKSQLQDGDFMAHYYPDEKGRAKSRFWGRHIIRALAVAWPGPVKFT
jgi:hypothetical protein